MIESMSVRLRAFVGSVLLAAILLLVLGLFFLPFAYRPTLVLLAVAVFVVAAFPVRLPGGGEVSTTYPIGVAILLLHGPLALGVVFSAVSIVTDVRERKNLVRIVFNAAQLLLSSLAAGTVFVLIVSRVGLDVPVVVIPESVYPGILLPTIAFAAAFSLINDSLVGMAITLSQGVSFIRVWRRAIIWHLATQIALTLLGLALTHLLIDWGLLGLIVFALPLLVSRGVFQASVRLREVYSDTVRGFVAAIEAKDPYTRGHSERVSLLTVGVAEEMNLSQSRVSQLELAALLHDLGKIGINRRILLKKGRLSDEEMETVRSHPEIGADIIGEIAFLRPMVSAIVHHHERWDGNGYCAGLKGEDIPLAARILTVTDCYDAMTSERPYKHALSMGEAFDELKAGQGSQFDVQVVSAFKSFMGKISEHSSELSMSTENPSS